MTGINGFLGRSIAQELSQKGFRVYGTSHQGQAAWDKQRAYLAGVYVFDLRCVEGFDLTVLKGVDLIIHAAFDSCSESLDHNVSGTAWLVKKGIEAEINDQVYLGSYIAEAQGLSAYSRVKFQTELIFLQYHLTVVRLGLVVGPGSAFNRVRSLIRLGIVPVPMPLPDLAISSRQSVAEGILKIATEGLKGEYNLHQGAMTTLSELMKVTATHLNKRILILPIPSIFIWFLAWLLDKCPIVLPLNSENLKGLLTSRKILKRSSDLALLKIQDRKLEDLIELEFCNE